jgi:nucleotide-binding universal stress UspA family protein
VVSKPLLKAVSNLKWLMDNASGKERRMKFLVGYNGSVEAKAALLLARDFAKIFKAKVFVMSSMEGGAGEKIEDINRAEQNLREAKELLDEAGIECETHQMARGLTPGEDLVKFAEENQIDQIYVGIEKKSKTSKLLLGSTAQYVILKARCPVITVK